MRGGWRKGSEGKWRKKGLLTPRRVCVLTSSTGANIPETVICEEMQRTVAIMLERTTQSCRVLYVRGT